MRPRLGQTVYCRSTGQPWTVASERALRHADGRTRRWRPGLYRLRRHYAVKRTRMPAGGLSHEEAVAAYGAELVRLAQSVGLGYDEAAKIRGDLVV